MKEIVEISEKEYRNFFNKSKYNHFLQSYEWGQSSKGKGLVPVYLGYKDENIIKAIVLCFKKEVPLNMRYYYAPRGPVIDYENLDLIKDFTEALKIYLKKNNAIYFKIDPGIVLHELDEKALPLAGHINNEKLLEYFKSLGYKFKGYTKLYEANQPRFTFRINTQRSIEDIEKDMNKTYLKTIKRSYNYDLQVCSDYDTHTFYSLMKDIANKDNFNGYPEKFYELFDKEFSKNNNVKYVTIKIYPDKILEKSRSELKDIESKIENHEIPEKKMVDTQNIISRLKKDIDVFKDYEGKYKDGLISLILICPIINKKMWTLYIGNNSLATYTFAVNRSYYEAIKIANEEKCEFLDLFGTCGDPTTTKKNYAGIHEYKRKMGGTYTEFIGEFDLINKPIVNIMFKIALKVYRKIKK